METDNKRPTPDTPPVLLEVPECLRRSKLLHGDNQRKALVYVAQKMQWKEDYTFSPVELSNVLGDIGERGSRKLLATLSKKGLLIDLGNTRFEIPPDQQRNHSEGWKVYGFTHFYVHQYRANVSAVKALFGTALPQKSSATITYPRIKEHNPNQVQAVLDRFLDKKGLHRTWSEKRKGWVIPCAGQCEHTDRKRRDETILFTTPKSNGFLLISARCRHESCGTLLMEWCKALNKEWGKYFYECQQHQYRPKSSSPYYKVSSPTFKTPTTTLDPTGECIISFMAKDEAETLIKKIQDADTKLNILRMDCWRESKYWKKYNDAKYRFTPKYWRYKQAWKPYYELREERDGMLSRLKELNAVIER